MKSKKITTERLYLLPFTTEIAREVMDGQFTSLSKMGLNLAEGWPDQELIECLPRVIMALELVTAPTGFESWMIIDKERKTIVGDLGFKGGPDENGHVDLGYGILASERRKGYAVEAGRALIKWAFKQPEVKVITAKCEHINAASTKTLMQLGFYQKFIKEEMVHWFLLREPTKKIVG
ncbi:GNAT family N-acetyltransferase [Pedobacter gandavensis]|uniref:GNAT family N-acetyltransferase n=1 Tax=Pedobacter gandavensis TaxID=2679963 RepID=UPI00292F1AD4|nr:GNAT family N-acetyltransferase [Pedobacter gandavensis]